MRELIKALLTPSLKGLFIFAMEIPSTSNIPPQPDFTGAIVEPEFERRWHVPSVPNGALEEVAKTLDIDQGYAKDVDHCKFRVRDARDEITDGHEYVLNRKEGSGIARLETERFIEEPEFDQIWPATEGWRLEKQRVYIPEGERVIHCDFFEGPLEGLVVAEIEFPSEREAEEFEAIPPWFGAEITGLKHTGNGSLAKRGIPKILRTLMDESQ